MSDSLLDMPLANQEASEIGNYYALLEKAVFHNNQGEGESESSAYLTSMTKAFMKDGNIDHALKFFEDGFQKRVKQRMAQDEFLVKLYDTTLGIEGDQKLDLNAFKTRYYKLMLVRERMKKEIKAVHMLEELLDRCDPEEIDNIFLLQIVLKEEKGLLQHLAKCSNEDYQHVHDLYYGLTQRSGVEAVKDGHEEPN